MKNHLLSLMQSLCQKDAFSGVPSSPCFAVAIKATASPLWRSVTMECGSLATVVSRVMTSAPR